MPEFPRPITLADGRQICLTHLYREETYLGLIEGVPSRSMNEGILQGIGRKGLGLFGHFTGQATPLLLPVMVQLFPAKTWIPRAARTHDDAKSSQREIMPGVASVALFSSAPLQQDPEDGDASFLAVQWFQHNPHCLMEEEPQRHLHQVKWEEVASSWRW